MNKISKIILISIVCLLLFISACSTQTAPAVTSTPEPTITPTPQPPFTGKLFFDMNGSGLQDESSFVYDPDRLNDRRQPLQPNLDKAIKEYVSSHPGLKKGDLVTLIEPGLSGYQVCIENDCVNTGIDGIFSIPNRAGKDLSQISIKDPYADQPALAMHYINEWKGSVTIPEYEKNVDEKIMKTLKVIPSCSDTGDAVCKKDHSTILVREQYLNDTKITPLTNKLLINSDTRNEFGLIQAFLSLPFNREQVSKPFIWNYFDIIGHRIFDGNHTYLNTQDGKMLSYDGKLNKEVDAQNFSQLRKLVHFSGVGDSHTGLDFLVEIGRNVVSGAPTSNVWFAPAGQINLSFEISGKSYDNCYGHMALQLLDLHQKVYRGQIVGLSGDVGDPSPFPAVKQLHFHLGEKTINGWKYLDPYRSLIDTSSIPINYWGNSISLWTSDNLPQFPHVG